MIVNFFIYLCNVKRLFLILFAVLLLACNKQSEPIVEPQPLPFAFSDTLLLIDSLMQRDAASALQTLQSFRAERGTSFEFNANYQSLLLSEALYKTDNAQLNRYKIETFQGTSLQDAMHYFDSLAAQYPGNDDFTLLSARSHYMNGVGFYENDSVVDACKEYLHTLEIMGNHFDEKQLVGYKAKFMGLTYNRLKELFTNQFMIENAIYCGKKSLVFYEIAPTSKYGISNTLAKLGQLYDISGQNDSAYYYYNEALRSLPDSNNLIYRDLISSMAVLFYELGYGLMPTLEQLKQVADQAESKDELLTRYYTIGSLYFEEKIYDSAIIYLNIVYDNEGNGSIRKLQTADFLMNINNILDDTLEANKYSGLLSKNTMSQYDKSLDSSKLNDIFQSYVNKKIYESHKRNKIRIIIVVSLILVITVLLYILLFTHSLNKINRLNKEHQRVVDSQKKNRYREKNKMLDIIKQQEIKVNALEQELGQKRQDVDLSMDLFMNEPVCKNIKKTVDSINVTSRVNYADYPYLKLDNATIVNLEEAVAKHFPNFEQRLFSRNPQLKQKELLLCFLYLLGVKDQQISVLMQYHYSTIFRKVKNLEKKLNIDVTLQEFVKKTAVL